MASLDVVTDRPVQVAVGTPRPAGPGLVLAASELVACRAAAARFSDLVTALLVAGERICVNITDLGRGPRTAPLVVGCMDALARATERAHVPARQVEVALPADALAPGEAWTLRRQRLGPGALHLVVDPGGSPGSRFWYEVWRLRRAGHVACLHRQTVRASSPLLANEHAPVVQPPLGQMVPRCSAWVWSVINVACFADGRGDVDYAAMEEALHFAVDEGDRLHDEHDWPLPAMRDDSWRNRRLAIHLTGLGDVLVRRNGSSPGGGDCAELAQLLRFSRCVLTGRSRWLAHRRGLLPALEQNDPTRLFEGPARKNWQARWRSALRTAAVRNRNLLALSPSSFLPAAPAPAPGYVELLSLLEYADICAFPALVSMPDWKFNDFRNLQEVTRVALRRREAARLIAEQV